MGNSILIKIVMLGGLWPFAGNDGDRLADVETIESLDGRSIEIPSTGEMQVDNREVLELYRQYLETPDGDPGMRLEAMRRLGDLSLSVGEDRDIEDPNYQNSMAYHEDAVLLYEQLLARYSNYEKADKVLYQLSRAYQSLGRPDDALTTLSRLVVEYPDSPYFDEAQFRRGELLFMRRDYPASALAYADVVEYGDRSSFYQQSLYKYGWAQFKQAEYDASIHAFLDLLNLRLQAAAAGAQDGDDVQAVFDSMSRPDRELANDALRVLSVTFSYLEGPVSIEQYHAARGRVDSAYLLYTSLGSLYLEKERFLDAAVAFAGFAESEPFHHNAPTLAMRSIESYKAGRFSSKVLEAKQDFVETYGLDRDYWSFYAPENRPDVIEPLKTNLSDLALHDHARAQKSGDPETYAQAANWYRRYLDYFPNDPDSAKRSFLLAEILTESKNFSEAMQFYVRAAYDYPGYEKASEAAYAGLLAAKAHANTLQGTARHDWDKQQLAASLRFARTFPAHEHAAPVLSNAAESYFKANEFDEAVVIAGRLLRSGRPVDPELTQVAWTVAAHGNFELQHFARAEHAYTQLRAIGGSRSLQGKPLDERIAAAIYRQAEAAQLVGDTHSAVDNYLRVESAAPLAATRVNAVYDAATLLIKEENWGQSIDVLQRFRSSFGANQFSDDVTQKLAVAYQKSGQPLASAREFERIAAMASVGPDVQREALWSSATLYETAGNVAQARVVWERFVKEFPEPLAESIEVRQRLADLAGSANDSQARRNWLVSIVDADARAGAQRSDRSKTLAAVASLEMAEPDYIAFAAVQLTVPLAASLKLKRARMETALAAYDKAAGYGVADVTTAATYRIAELYYQLGADLMDSERPPRLGADELEQYDILLEEQAFPFEEKAIELFEVNAARTTDGVYDEWVAKSFARLAAMMPARYAKYEKAEPYVANLY